MNHTLTECRWLYNHLLEQRKKAFEASKITLSLYEQHGTLTALKRERPSLKTVHSQVLQNVAVRIDLGFKAFFRRVKAGEKPGYLRFRGVSRYDSFCYPQSGFKLNGEKLFLSKIGDVKVVLHRPVEGDIKTCCIRRSSNGKWFACLSTEQEIEVQEVDGPAIGIDVGLTTFVTSSHLNTIETPRFFRSEEKALGRAQRCMDKHPKGSYERNRKRRAVSRIHERIANKRRNFAHQHSRKLIDANAVVCVENLEVNRMVHNHCLAKSIHDAAWTQFTNFLEYKADWAGKRVIRVNPAYTSQTFSSCGHRQKMPLASRRYLCPCCGLSLDRDHNAALNILALGLQSVGRKTVEALGFSRGE